MMQKKAKLSKFLTVPIQPIPIDRDRSVAGLLEKMESAGFGAKQIAEAHRIWLDMLDDNTTIYLCASGNLIPAGMRRLLAYVIKNRFVDVLIVSGKILFHDIHETLGRNHYQAHPSMSDEELEVNEVYRVGNVLANLDEYREADEWIGSVINQLDLSRSYTVREFLHVLGRELSEIANEDGILTSAFKARVPVFCPDISGSELAVGIARERFEKKNHIYFDTAQDTIDLMLIAQRARNSGLIALGSTNSQEMLAIADFSSYLNRINVRGHKYAISIVTDGFTMDTRTPSINASYKTVFGKLAKGALTAYVPCDPSIALPLIITAMSQTAAKYMKARKRPSFSFAGKELTIEIP
ncbi:MAG: deoxyhypusine synthase family protein [Pyrinomonadaceae bacterium]|nr:deoxyhypusine synthase family protein [Pyrinomonadaceae bacterium]MCX7640404.1 deoxyhypusine synthase family protein [Pyrinomonadaceae bacterium]MDW8304831.1 deoxyhypusine synthase family protein [Acidobacteriota bacterium]